MEKVIGAIIQARMGSKRLPEKVLRKIGNIPLLKYQIERIEKSKHLKKIIVATSNRQKDNPIEEFCMNNKIECFRGEEEDVLNRYYECAKAFGIDTVVRLTGDCPFVDPNVIDNAIRLFNEEGADFVANTVPPENSRYPNGSDVEVFSKEALERAYRECGNAHDREHVTFYFWKHDNGFKTVQLTNNKDYSKYRFTVDYQEDLEVVAYIADEIQKRGIFGHIEEIVDILEENKEIKQKNSHYEFDIGWKNDQRQSCQKGK